MTTEISGERGTEPDLRARPVIGWAAAGLVFAAIGTYVLAGWLASGPEPTPVGPVAQPAWRLVYLDVMQIGTTLAYFVVGYFVVYRPWRRTGAPTLYGLLYIAFTGLFWQDHLMDYVRVTFTYNAHMLNLGSWIHFVPGSIAPNGEKIAFPLYLGFAYPTNLFLAVLGIVWVMRRIKRRWPRMRNGTLMCITYPITAVSFLIFYVIYILTGWCSYPQTIEALTLWPGTSYQIPVYDPLLISIPPTIWACMLYTRDGNGRVFAERGIERVKGGLAKLTWIRLFALYGVLSAVWIGTYYLPSNIVTLHADYLSPGVLERPYLSNGVFEDPPAGDSDVLKGIDK